LKSIGMQETLQPFLDYNKQLQDAPYVKKTKKKVSASKPRSESQTTNYEEDQLDSGFIEKENKFSANSNSAKLLENSFSFNNYEADDNDENPSSHSKQNGDIISQTKNREQNMNDYNSINKDTLEKGQDMFAEF